jgi:homoserine kinase
MALDIRLTLSAEWSDATVALPADPQDWWRESVRITRTGTLSDPAGRDLVAEGFLSALGRGHAPASLHCTVHSDIPVAQGLGSSAAATVVGAALAQVWRTGQADRHSVFLHAAALEGHADNAAAATHGGVQAALLSGDEPRAAAVAIHDDIRVAVCAPNQPLKESTHASRSSLPDQLKHADAVSNQRALLTLIHGLRTADADALQAAMRDRLHVPYRKGMIAGYDDIVDSALSAGAYACTLSGAGASLIALGTGDMQPVADAMRLAFERHGMAATPLTPAIDRRGLIVQR